MVTCHALDLDLKRNSQMAFQNSYRSGTIIIVQTNSKKNWTFLPCLQRWKSSVIERDRFTKSDKQRMLLSGAMLNGLRMTSMKQQTNMFNQSTTCMYRQFLHWTGQIPFPCSRIHCLLHSRLCVTGKGFGRQCQIGSTNDNPMIVKEFYQNM